MTRVQQEDFEIADGYMHPRQPFIRLVHRRHTCRMVLGFFQCDRLTNASLRTDCVKLKLCLAKALTVSWATCATASMAMCPAFRPYGTHPPAYHPLRSEPKGNEAIPIPHCLPGLSQYSVRRKPRYFNLLRKPQGRDTSGAMTRIYVSWRESKIYFAQSHQPDALINNEV